MGVSCGRGKEDEDLMFKSIFRKEMVVYFFEKITIIKMVIL